MVGPRQDYEDNRRGSNGNGNGKNWILYLSLFLSVIAFGRTLFYTDSAGARIEEQVKFMQLRQDKEDNAKENMELRLNVIEKSQLKEEIILQEQTGIMNKMQDELSRRGKDGHAGSQ